MTIWLTGAAGFIGSHVAAILLDQGHDVVGIDVLNNAYDPKLKDWRLARLKDRPGFTFHRADICDREALTTLLPERSRKQSLTLPQGRGCGKAWRTPGCTTRPTRLGR